MAGSRRRPPSVQRLAFWRWRARRRRSRRFLRRPTATSRKPPPQSRRNRSAGGLPRGRLSREHSHHHHLCIYLLTYCTFTSFSICLLTHLHYYSPSISSLSPSSLFFNLGRRRCGRNVPSRAARACRSTRKGVDGTAPRGLASLRRQRGLGGCPGQGMVGAGVRELPRGGRRAHGA